MTGRAFVRQRPSSRLPVWLAAVWAAFWALSTFDDLRLLWPNLVATPVDYSARAVQVILVGVALASAGSRPRLSMVTCGLALGMSLFTGSAGFAAFALLVVTVQTAVYCRPELVLAHGGIVAGWLAWLWLINPRQEYWGIAIGALLAAGVGFLVRLLLLRSEASHQRVTEFAAAAWEAREHERLVLARQLHDSVASELTRISLRVSSVDGPADPGEQSKALAEIQMSALAALSELSDLVDVLSSKEGSLPDRWETRYAQGLTSSRRTVAEISAEATRTLRSAGFDVTEVPSTPVAGSARSMPPDGLVRVLQLIVKEGVTNVLKHGRAGGSCQLAFDEGADRIRFELINEVNESSSTGFTGNGVGLDSIRGRVSAIGGELSIAQGTGSWALRACLHYPRPGKDDARPSSGPAPLRLGQATPSS